MNAPTRIVRPCPKDEAKRIRSELRLEPPPSTDEAIWLAIGAAMAFWAGVILWWVQ
jgi:hypothetical protein